MSTRKTPNPLHPTFNERGESTSPLLDGKLRNFILDIDGTICDDVPNEEPERMKLLLPYPEALKMINAWYDAGNIITFFTSRSSEQRELTEEWLNRSGFKYHALIMDKPRGGRYHWIDNNIFKATRYKQRFVDLMVEDMYLPKEPPQE